MDTIEHEGTTITIYEGKIKESPPTGFIIYGTPNEYMLAYSDDCGVIHLNITPLPNLELATEALKKWLNKNFW